MTLIPVNKQTLGGKRLKAISSYSFIADAPFCEIVGGEFASVAVSYPIFFIEKNGGYRPVALFTLRQGENLFVEKDGSWSGYYMPMNLCRYPFTLTRTGSNGEGTPILMYDDASGLVSDTEGEPLFSDDPANEMNTPVARTIQLMAQIDVQGGMTRQLTEKIAAAGLLEPGNLTVEQNDQRQPLTGLFKVDEERLNALTDETFLELRHSGALALIFMHLVSLGQLARLQARFNFRQIAAQGVQQSESANRLVFDSII